MTTTTTPEPTTKELNSYYERIIDGQHGIIQTKHQKLAKLITKNKWSFMQILDYAKDFSEYDEWTFKDFDKACAFSAHSLTKTHLQKCAEAIENDPAAAIAAARRIV